MASGHKTKIFWAFAAIYFVWGSTYLAIRIVVREIPPMAAACLRFLADVRAIGTLPRLLASDIASDI